MDALLTKLPALHDAVSMAAEAGANRPRPDTAAAYIRSLRRKAGFVQTHYKFLSIVSWDEQGGLGRETSDGVVEMAIPMREATLTIWHPDAFTDYVYMSFDGLVAALVNMTDTIGRLVNDQYGLELPERRASLRALKDPKYCQPESPIGKIVHNSMHTEWLVRLADLRGRCQHADIEEVLLHPAGPYSLRGEPFVPKEYDWASEPSDMQLVAYCDAAMRQAEQTLVAVIEAVCRSPEYPYKG